MHLSIDTIIATAIQRHLAAQIGAGPTARAFVRLEGFSAATYGHLLTALADRQWQLAGRTMIARSAAPISGHPEVAMDLERSATWYRNHLPAGQTLLIILNRRTSDAQSLQDIYVISEQSLTRDGLGDLIGACFGSYQLDQDQERTLTDMARRLRRLRMEPQLRDLTEFFCAVDRTMADSPGVPLAEAITNALPALNLFRCRELAAHLNTHRGDKLLRTLKEAAQIGSEVLDDRVRQEYLDRLERAALADDSAFGRMSPEKKADLLRRFIDGALSESRNDLQEVLSIDWQEASQIIVARGRSDRTERYQRAADRLLSAVAQDDVAQDDDLVEVVESLRDGREPDGEALERLLSERGETLPKALCNDLRRMVRPRTRRSADFPVGLASVAIDLLHLRQGDLPPGARLRVALAPGALEGRNRHEAARIFQLVYGGIERAFATVQWQIDALWGFAQAPAELPEEEGDERDRLTRDEIPFRVTLLAGNGADLATAELVWQYRSDSPAAATAHALAAERALLAAEELGPLFAGPPQRLRVPIYNGCQPLDEIGDLDLRHPLSSLGAWYEQPSDLRAVLEQQLKPAARPPVWGRIETALADLETAWGQVVLVASREGLLEADTSMLIHAYAGLLRAACGGLTAGSEVGAGFRALNQAWVIGPPQFDRWAVLPLLHPLKLLWWRERVRFLSGLIARLLDSAPATIVDVRRFQQELGATYGSSGFPPVLALPAGNRPAARFLPVEEAEGYELYFHEDAGAEAFGLDPDLLAEDENALVAQRAVEGIVAVAQDYIETYPFVRDGVEILLFECRNGALPGLLVEALAKAARRRGWSVRLTVVVHTSSRGAPLFRRVSRWVAGGYPGVDRQDQTYFPPVTMKVLECLPEELFSQHDDTDMVVLADVLAERGQQVRSELEPLDLDDLPAEGYLPTYRARQEPFQQGEESRRILLSAPQQPAVARLFLLAQHAALDKQKRALRPDYEARFYRDLTLDDWKPVIARLHERFNWVICYDTTIDRFLLQATFRDAVQVIRYSLGLGAKRQHNLTVSSSGRAQTIVTRRLANRLGQMFPGAAPFCGAVARELVEEAKQVSGDIVLRAAGPGAFLNELIGLVVAKFATEQRYRRAYPDALTAWILLDDVEHWFSGKFPDLLFVAIGAGGNRGLCLHMEVLEAKCVGEISFDAEASDAQTQVRAGVGRLAAAFAPGYQHLDALYWYDQLYRAVVGNLVVLPAQQELWELFRERLHTGDFALELSGHAWVFCYDGQADVETDGSTQPFASRETDVPGVPLLAHHHGRNELAGLLSALVRARGGPETPPEIWDQPAQVPLTSGRSSPNLPLPNPFPTRGEGLDPYQEDESPPSPLVGEGGWREEGVKEVTLHHVVEEALLSRAREKGTGGEGHAARPDTPVNPLGAGVKIEPPTVEQGSTAAPTPAAPDAVERQWIGEKARELERSLRRRSIQVLPIDAALADVGPSIVRFKLRLSGNETIKKLQATAVDLARDLALIRTPFIDNVLGTNYVGVDLPRERPEIIDLLPLLRGLGHPDSGDLPIIIGKTPDGRMHIDNLADFPHALVAGATGSGKSVFLRSLLLSLITQYQPGRLEILIVDPKQTDFSFFDGLPHLRGGKVFTDASEARDALLELVRSEMPRRQQIMRGRSLKLKDFNQRFPAEALPPIVAMIDEYAQLLSIMNKKDSEQFERDLMSLAAVARATSIHLVLATQRPSVDVVTGTLKANLPTRIAFQVPTNNDSRVVLDAPGAENLLGKGDMLLRRASGEILRLQAPFMSEEAMQAYLVGFRT